MVDKQDEFVKKSGTGPEKDPMHHESAMLEKLARGQGMNTEIRRGIFIVLMSSDVRYFYSSQLSVNYHLIHRTMLMLVSDFRS